MDEMALVEAVSASDETLKQKGVSSTSVERVATRFTRKQLNQSEAIEGIGRKEGEAQARIIDHQCFELNKLHINNIHQ